MKYVILVFQSDERKVSVHMGNNKYQEFSTNVPHLFRAPVPPQNDNIAYIEYDCSGEPGTALAKLLKDAGIGTSKECSSCFQYKTKLNTYGNAWVLDNIEEVVNELATRSKAPKVILEELVLLAVEESEKELNKEKDV